MWTCPFTCLFRRWSLPVRMDCGVMGSDPHSPPPPHTHTHTHGICVPPLLSSQAWNRTRPVEGFRLYRLGTTWSLKSCFSVLELLPRISVLNDSICFFSPSDAAAHSRPGPHHYRGLMIPLFRLVNGLSQRPLPDSTQHSKNKQISMPLAGFGWAVIALCMSALRQGSTHLCPQEYTEHSCDCLLLDPYT